MKLVYSNFFLSENEKKEAWTNIKKSNYGLGFEVNILNKTYSEIDDDDFSIGHGGSQEKAKNLFAYFPGKDKFIIFMSNSENLDYRDFFKKIIIFLNEN